MKSKKFIAVLKSKKMLLFEEIDKNVQFTFSEIRKIFICILVKQVAFYLSLKKSCPSEAVSSLRFSL